MTEQLSPELNVQQPDFLVRMASFPMHAVVTVADRTSHHLFEEPRPKLSQLDGDVYERIVSHNGLVDIWNQEARGSTRRIVDSKLSIIANRDRPPKNLEQILAEHVSTGNAEALAGISRRAWNKEFRKGIRIRTTELTRRIEDTIKARIKE